MNDGTAAPRASVARLVAGLAGAAVVLLVCGLAAGSQGWSFDWHSDAELITAIRLPRTLGAGVAGALLGLAGAIAQGLFRNPLADPFLLGTTAGAGLGVVLVLAAGGLLGAAFGSATVELLQRAGLIGAAFVGALLGVSLTLLFAGGSARPTVLLLAGVVVSVLLTAIADLVVLLAPEALRGKQVFLLGTTSFLGWPSLAVLVTTALIALPAAVRLARALDALVLGDATAASLGLPLARARALLIGLMALATGSAVAQVGLVAFVGLVAPHLVRRAVVVTHGRLLALAALAGGVLLMAADVAARTVVAPQELPVGMLTAVCGGLYLLVLLHRRQRR